MFKNFIRDKKKLGLIIGIILIVVLVVIVLVNIFSGDGLIGEVNNPDGEKFKNEYEELNGTVNEDGKNYPEVNLSSDNVIKYSNSSEILSIFENKGDAVIYFGYSACLYCRSVVEVLCDTAASTELDSIYYLDVEKPDDRYEELVNVLEDKFITEEGKIYTPLVIFVSDGSVVSHNKGTLFSQEDPYVELDKYQVEGLAEIYKHGINDVLDSMKNN